MMQRDNDGVIKYVFVVCEFVVSGSHARRGVVVVVNIDKKQTWKFRLQDKNPTSRSI
jgi:hypothetical protein